MAPRHPRSPYLFWLGLRDWWAARARMSPGEAVAEVRASHGRFFWLRPPGVVLAVFLLLGALGMAAAWLVPAVTRSGFAPTSETLRNGAGLAVGVFAWVVLAVVPVVGLVRGLRFYDAMCARGAGVLARRSIR